MSGTMPGTFDPHNPFASQKGGTYDANTLQGLYLRAQKGDINARQYLSQIGVLGNQGQDIWANNDTQAGNFAPAINAWAQNTGSTPYAGPGFAYQDKWATSGDDPTFARAWDSWFQTGGQGTDFQKVNPADPSQPGNTGKPSVAGTPPAATAGPYGYTYSAPPGLNAWGTYDGGRGYQGGDGVYNPQADTAKGWGPNGHAELDRDRVWRMTLDQLQGNRDPAAVQAAYLANIARLHRDYRDTPGLGEAAWARSAFAGYDKYLATSQAGGQRGQPVVDPRGTPGDPNNPAGTQPSGTPPPAGTPPPTTYTDPITGQTKTYSGNLDPTQLAKNVALSDPQNQDARLSYIMRQYGIDPTRAGLYTASLARSLSPQIEAANQLNGIFGDTNAIDTAQSNMDNLARSLAAPGGFARQQANARGILADPRLQTLAGGLSDPQMIDTLQTILSQAYAGSNPIYNQSRLGYFNQALGPGGAYGQYSLDHPQTGAPGYQHPLDWLRNTPWANLLAGY
jgi:hypothetical protein